MKLARLSTVACLIAITGSASAATDGSLDTTSEGTAVVNIAKQNVVKITNLDDIDLGTAGILATTATGTDDVCVYSSTGGYGLVVTSSNEAFELRANGSTTNIEYSVGWEANIASDITYNILLGGLVGNPVDVDCDGQTNASFTISVEPNDFNAAEPGTYTDTLILLVQPM